MLDLWPIGIEFKRRTVVEVMALQAVICCPLLSFWSVDGQNEFLPQAVAFGQACTHIAPLNSSMRRSWSMAVLAALMRKMRCRFHTRKATFEWFESLWSPANNVA